MERIEAMETVDLMAWHARAVVRKKADLEAAGATAQMLAAIFASRGS